VASSSFDSTTPYAANLASDLVYDPTGAGALLDAAGWKIGEGGYRFKDGRKLTLTQPLTAALAGDQLVQDQLKKVGIDLKLQVLTQAQYTEAIAAGKFDLMLTYYTRADPSVLGSVLDQAVSKAGTATFTQDAATGAKVSELFAAGLKTTDPAKRAAAYTDLQSYLVKQGVSFPTYERVQVAGLSSKVHGFAWTSESFLRANDIWLGQ
jgi:peptide/nickel transport system substrate-binding protein